MDLAAELFFVKKRNNYTGQIILGSSGLVDLR